MVVLDILILTIFTIFIILGIWKGIIGSVFKFAGIGSGVVLAFIIYEEFATFMSNYITFFKSNSAMSYIVAFLIILVATIMLFLLGAKIVTYILGILKLKWLDNLIGGIFGFTIALIINSGIIFGAKTLYDSDVYPQFNESLSKEYFLPLLIDTKHLLAKRDSIDLNDFINIDKMKKDIGDKIDNINVTDILPDSLKLKDLNVNTKIDSSIDKEENKP